MRDDELDLAPIVSEKPVKTEVFNRFCLKLQVRVKAIVDSFLEESKILTVPPPLVRFWMYLVKQEGFVPKDIFSKYQAERIGFNRESL